MLSTIIRDHNAHAKLSENKLKFLLDYLASHLIEGGAAAPVVGRRWTDKDTAIYKGEAQTERTAMALTLLKAIVNAKIVLVRSNPTFIYSLSCSSPAFTTL